MYEIIDTAAAMRHEVAALGEIRGLIFPASTDEVRAAVNDLIRAEAAGEPTDALEEFLGIVVTRIPTAD